jgi:hypothetical protein
VSGKHLRHHRGGSLWTTRSAVIPAHPNTLPSPCGRHPAPTRGAIKTCADGERDSGESESISEEETVAEAEPRSKAGTSDEAAAKTRTPEAAAGKAPTETTATKTTSAETTATKTTSTRVGGASQELRVCDRAGIRALGRLGAA